MRYRKGILKKEHGILPGLESLLQQLSEDSDVRSIVPGRIYASRGRSGGKLHVRASTPTATGLKLIARRGSSVQEVFVVCSQPDRITQVLKSLQS